MPFIADLHVHSRYSRATSKNADLVGYYEAAQKKGVDVAATGDFTHPVFLQEIKDSLVENGEGLYSLKDDLARPVDQKIPEKCRSEVRFMLSVEISSIYKKNGKTRKVHNVVFAPDIPAAGRIVEKLDKIGNLKSDGRPILGLDSRDLLEIVLEADDRAFLVPAHIWTPHFSVFGAFSGFESIEECFDDLADRIFAVETGLSSDPPMNWTVPALDGLTLLSNSDAHSPVKLAREANILDCKLSYPAMRRAIETREGFLGTLEFFPEEGKYHMDGHRACEVCLSPEDTRAAECICPVCKRKLTLGVMHRVSDLAGRLVGEKPESARPFESIVPLPEVIGSAVGRGPATKTVAKVLDALMEEVGSELYVLREAPIEEIEEAVGERVAEGVRRVREKRVHLDPGYDGRFGVVSVFSKGE